MAGHGSNTDPHGFPVGRRLRFFKGEPVTEPLPIEASLRNTPYRDPAVMQTSDEEGEVRKSLELAVRVGELLLRCGAGTRDVEASVVAVAAAAGVRRLEVDITNQSLLVQCPTPSGAPVTMLRVVRSNTRDFARLTAIHQFVHKLVTGGIDDVDAATKELRTIQRKSRLYPRWLVSAGYAGLAGGVCALLGGGSMAIVLAIISALLIDNLNRWLNKRGIPAFYQATVGSAVSVVLAWLGYLIASRHFLGLQMSTADFAYAVSAGIVVLLPGRAMASAVEDAITGYPVTGAGRILTVIMSSAGIVVGVAAGLSVTLRLDDALGLELTSPKALNFSTPPTSIMLQVICGAIGAGSSALTMRALPRHILPTAVLGGTALAGTAYLTRTGAVGATTAVALSAIGIGILGRLIALRLGAPALVLVVPAVSPLLPGLRIFRGMYDGVAGSIVGTSATAPTTSPFTTLVGAVGFALAIATGVVLGDLLSAPLDRQVLGRKRARRR